MSKELIKNLQKDEMNCYVCRKPISDLVSLQIVYNDNTAKFALTPKEFKALRDTVNENVVCAGIKVFRHSGCNPLNFKPDVGDL